MEKFFEHIVNKFTNFGIIDFVDILIVTVFLYMLFLYLKRNNALIVAKIFPIVVVVFALIIAFGLPISSLIVKIVFVAGLILFVVVFGLEIKRDIWKMNSGRRDSHFSKEKVDEEELRNTTRELVKSVQNMAKNDIGAIIVLCQSSLPTNILESGVALNASISAELIESVFNTKSPLHDGAILIRNNTILAAGCFLPLSSELNLPKELGTRHRAGIGISESEDVTCIVVSEETGVISIAQKGKLKRYVDGQILTETLEKVFNIEGGAKAGKLSLKRR